MIIGYVINGIIFGLITKYISGTKGYEGGFAWGFWLGFIGLIVVGVRPTITTPSTYDEKPHYISPASNSDSQWECVCGAKNSNNLNYCLSCRRSRSEAEVNKITCPSCGTKNTATNSTCFVCGASLHPDQNNTAAEKADDPASLLEKLAKLHEQGVLTDDEFQQKKADLLAKM